MTIKSMKSKLQKQYPQVFSFQWTGYWRVYSHKLENDNVLSGPCRDEQEAWKLAYAAVFPSEVAQ
jgi:hypothetical protein